MTFRRQRSAQDSSNAAASPLLALIVGALIAVGVSPFARAQQEPAGSKAWIAGHLTVLDIIVLQDRILSLGERGDLIAWERLDTATGIIAGDVIGARHIGGASALQEDSGRVYIRTTDAWLELEPNRLTTETTERPSSSYNAQRPLDRSSALTESVLAPNGVSVRQVSVHDDGGVGVHTDRGIMTFDGELLPDTAAGIESRGRRLSPAGAISVGPEDELCFASIQFCLHREQRSDPFCPDGTATTVRLQEASVQAPLVAGGCDPIRMLPVHATEGNQQGFALVRFEQSRSLVRIQRYAQNAGLLQEVLVTETAFYSGEEPNGFASDDLILSPDDAYRLVCDSDACRLDAVDSRLAVLWPSVGLRPESHADEFAWVRTESARVDARPSGLQLTSLGADAPRSVVFTDEGVVSDGGCAGEVCRRVLYSDDGSRWVVPDRHEMQQGHREFERALHDAIRSRDR